MFSLFPWGQLQFKSSSSNASGFSGCSSGCSCSSHSPSSSKSISSFRSTSGFTLTELIVVITILAILSVIGFVVMSHQSSVARDGKRISDIKTLSESARITSAQLRLLPTPIADSIALSVSGTFIGYQGFMSLALVNPLGYGSDKIFDPKDNIPYTYRVNQHYDSAQFMAYLENPRFERSIEIAKQSLPSTLPSSSIASLREAIKMSGEDILSGEGFLSKTYAFDTAYALDSSTTDLSSRYPYSAGDRLGIFVSKGSNQPLQNGVTGTGSRDISLSDTSTLTIIVGSSGADGYVSTDISTGSLLSLKDGSFDEKALLGMNGGSSGSGGESGSGGGDSGGGGLPVSHILTMGEYSIMGETYYGYIGPQTISLYATFGTTITTVTPGSLIDDTVDGYVIDSLFWNSDYSSSITILAGSTDMPSNIAYETPYANLNCTNSSVIDSLTMYSCTGSTVSTDFYVGSQHDLGITIPSWSYAADIIDAPLNQDIISDAVTASIPSPATISITNGELRVNGGTWVTSTSINDTDQIEYKTQVTQKDEVKTANIYVDSILNSQWIVYANSCYTINNNTTITGYDASCGLNVTIPATVYGKTISAIGSYAFDNIGIQSIVIPSTITSIGIYAFAFNQLTSLTIPSSITTIRYNSFRNNQLTSVTIPSSVTSIEDGAFVSNQLASITIPSSVTDIGGFGGGIPGGAFQSNQLTSINIPNSVISIGRAAFFNNQLTSVTIPNSVTSIGLDAFKRNQLTLVTIPNSVTSIGEYAFENNQLTSVTIPNSVTNVGNSAFKNNQLTSLVIGNGLTSIEFNTFENNQLTSVTIPNSVTSIGFGAFKNNKLTSVTIPNSVTSMSTETFGFQVGSLGNGTVYGPSSGYVKNTYTNNYSSEFDKIKLPNYVDQ